MPAYPRPTAFLPTVPLNPRRLLPLEIPPIRPPQSLPPLPSPPRKSLLAPSWALTTHFVPAAYPRTTPYIPPHQLPKFSGSKEDYKLSVDQTARSALDAKLAQIQDPSPDRDKTLLWTCLNRYVPTQQQPSSLSRRPITLLLAHANGFPKEIWEPTLVHLLKSLTWSSPPAFDIAEIWVWEAVNHGDAGLVNAHHLSGLYDWQDNARDILHFLLSYLPSSPSQDHLPTHLDRIPQSLTDQRERVGFQNRSLVAVGHSFGGCSSVLAGLTHPSLFSSIILVDPIIRPLRPGKPISSPAVDQYVMGAIGRKHHWASREEAKTTFAASPFFKTWDPKVLDVYVECGLKDKKDGGVELKMPGIQEALVFTENMTTYETFRRLSELDEKIELRWIMPGLSPLDNGTCAQELVWLRAANSSHVVFPDAGHLIAQEVPKELGTEIYTFLRRKYGSSVQSRL